MSVCGVDQVIPQDAGLLHSMLSWHLRLILRADIGFWQASVERVRRRRSQHR